MLKTSGNVLTLLLTGPPSSLSETNTTILSSKKRVLLQPHTCIFSLRQPQTSMANSQQTPTPQILLTATHHFSWNFTCRELCFLFHGQNIQIPSFSHQPPCHVIYALDQPLFLPLPRISQSSPLPQKPEVNKIM